MCISLSIGSGNDSLVVHLLATININECRILHKNNNDGT